MRFSNALKLLTPLLALLVVLAAPAYSATVTLTVSTDKPSYVLGETVTITGTVKVDTAAKANVLVNVEVTDPSGTLRHADVVKTGSDGSFTTSFRLAETLPTGTYTVKAVYAGVSKTTTFTVSAVPTFTIALTPETIAVPQGFYETVNVQLEAVAGYGYNVTLSATAVEGLSVSFTKATGVPGFESIAVVAASLDAAKGTYTVVIEATGKDGTVASKNLTVTVVDAPPAIAELNETVSKLETDLSSLKEELSSLKLDVDALKDTTSSLTTRLLNIETAIESLSNDVSSLKEDVSGLKESVSSLSDSLSSLSSTVSDVQGAVGGISGASYGAIILSVIALIVAIYALVTLQRRLAS